MTSQIMTSQIMTSDIAVLRPAETIAFDHDRLAAVCNEYGRRAEAYIAFVLSEVEALVGAIAHQRGEPQGLRRSCGDLIRLCDSIGMATLARAARAVLDCLDTGDAAALGACTARLLRLGRADGIGGWTLGRDPARDAVPETVA